MSKEKSEGRRPFQEWIPDEAVKHAQAAREEFGKSVEGLFPPEFLNRRRAARKEMLLAIRSVIDHALDRIEGRKDAE